jgi:dephospho-CoA kinase
MLIIGLTGSIGMGKSTVAAHLRRCGIPVFDADAEVHRLYSGEAVPLIEQAFPGTTGEGTVDRAKLSARLTAEPSGFKRLEAIIHPLVAAAERAFLKAAAKAGSDIAVLEIPLLLETGGESRVDVTIVVSAGLEKQRERVLARPGMTEAKLSQILARQMSDAAKRRKADFVVDTSGEIADTEKEIDRILESLKGRQGGAFARHWS